MTPEQRPAPSEYTWYRCTSTLPVYSGYCMTDPCLFSSGCPSEFLYSTLPFFTSQTAEVPQSSLGPTTSSSIYTPTSASPTSKTISTQQSATASPTRLGSEASGPSSSHLVFFILGPIGGVLVILIIILTLCHRRRRKGRNSAEGLPTHGGVPEPFLDDGPVESISNPTPTHGGVPEPFLDDGPVESISNPTPNPALAPH